MKKYISSWMIKSRMKFIPPLYKLTKMLQMKRFSVETCVELVPNFDFSLKAKEANQKCMSVHHYVCKEVNVEIVRLLLEISPKHDNKLQNKPIGIDADVSINSKINLDGHLEENKILNNNNSLYAK